MPPKFLFTREQVVQAALNVVRSRGASGLTARALAESLGSSAKPIFSLFKNMEEVQTETLKAAYALYLERLHREMSAGEYPEYKAGGMAYIRFARDERELFKLLFMRDRTHEDKADDDETLALVDLIARNTGLSREKAYLLHLETWIYVHGIASMIATGYLNWDMEFVSRALSDCYLSLRERFCEEEKCDGRHKN